MFVKGIEISIFGEMTFTPGFDTFSQSFQEELGKYVN